MAFHYVIEIRDLNLNLVQVLQKEVKDLSWSYNTEGGCGDCSLSLESFFDDYGELDLDYDVQIWRVTDAFGSPGARLDAQFGASGIQLGTAFTSSRELRWSGFVRQMTPTLQESEVVALGLSGYQRQLEYIAVPSVSYFNMDVGEIARNIIDTYVAPSSRILRTPALGLVQNVGVVANNLNFDSQAGDIMRTLAAIGQNAEWGVRADRQFYFVPRSTAVKQQWEIGDRIKLIQTGRSTDEVVTRVFLRGGAGLTATLINANYSGTLQKQRIVYQPAIVDADDAALWGLSYFSKYGTAQPRGQLRLGATDAWIENFEGQSMPPLGRVRIHGGPQFITGGMTGAVFGASGMALPAQLSGAYAGVTDMQYRIDSIRYQPTENGLDIDVDLGEKRGSLTDALRSIEFRMGQLTQGLTQ